MNLKRVRNLNNLEARSGPVVYWMNRDQRLKDNWALLFALELAKRQQVPLLVVFTLRKKFAFATERMLEFMLSGLQEVEAQLKKKNVPFVMLFGEPVTELARFINLQKVGSLVTDFNPLRYKQTWNRQLVQKLRIPFYEVDAHNIVPAWVVSQKQEYGAYTLRPKLHRLLPEFLEEYPKIGSSKYKVVSSKADWERVRKSIKTDKSVKAVSWARPGEVAGLKALRNFLSHKLGTYANDRNDPSLDGQSGLSAYLHFGQLSTQRVALEVLKHIKKPVQDVFDKRKSGSAGGLSSASAFLEELIVRRELSDNFCLYNKDYDSPEGFPAWAKKSLEKHRSDPREYIYSEYELEKAKTHDALWNAGQMQMVKTGKMHGYMRMYWAKKILEWSRNASTAMKTAIYLNDKYSLDGRDPNGYAGIAWSLGGVHDRAWFERKIFGLVRYMSYGGARSKFDTEKYVNNVWRSSA